MTPNQKIVADIKAAQEPKQPFFCDGSLAMVELEAMVDRAGMRNVLYALAAICAAKGEHLRVNWQDAKEARLWERDGDKLSQLTTHIAASGAKRVRGAI